MAEKIQEENPAGVEMNGGDEPEVVPGDVEDEHRTLAFDFHHGWLDDAHRDRQSLPQRLLQILHRRHGGLAGEILADVGGGFAGDGFHAGESFVVRGEPLLCGAAVGVKQRGMRQEFAAEVVGECFELGRTRITSEDDLLLAAMCEIEGHRHDRDGGGIFFDRGTEEREDFLRLLLVTVLREHGAEADEVERGE